MRRVPSLVVVTLLSPPSRGRQEQLGVKLESQTGPIEVLVVESVERQTPN